MIGFVRGGTEEELSQDKVREWKRLSKLAPTVLIRSNGSGQTKDVSCALQVALGHADDADAAKQAYEDKAAEIREKYADVLAENTFVALDAYEDEVSVFSPISWIGDVLADAGATPLPLVADETTENAAFLSTEELRQVDDATVVLYSETVDGELDLGAVDLQKAPTYAELTAVKAGHAYGVPYFFADRYATGLETLQALEEILQDLQG
ncbi:ABC transporter substrate-binding protein [Nocardioides humi]|nr:ABC transporter substrate-binding protein [Nocardioides humi]